MENSETKFIIQQTALSHKLIKKVDAHLFIHGISFTEYMILYYLYAAPNQTMRRVDLAESVGISASGVTRLIAPMEKIKLVEKESNSRDARVSLVRLSAPGDTVFKQASESFALTAKTLIRALSAKQLLEMINFTEQLSV